MLEASYRDQLGSMQVCIVVTQIVSGLVATSSHQGTLAPNVSRLHACKRMLTLISHVCLYLKPEALGPRPLIP